MQIKRSQNQPNFEARIGRIQTKKIYNKHGQEVLDFIKELAPNIIKDEKKYGDKSYVYSFILQKSGDFEVIGSKLFEKNYPESKTTLGKFINKIMKVITSEFVHKSALTLSEASNFQYQKQAPDNIRELDKQITKAKSLIDNSASATYFKNIEKRRMEKEALKKSVEEFNQSIKLIKESKSQ